jgi:hypothetical protein
MKFLLSVVALSSVLAASAALAQTPAPAPSANAKSTMSTSKMPAGEMKSSAGHTKETKMDKMMVSNCKAMPKDKMAQDAECQDYMKNHPNWMKSKK